MTATRAVEQRRGRGVGLALLSATGFSTLGLFARLIYSEGFSLQAALAWRFTTAALVLWIVVLATGRRLPRPVWPVVALGFLGFAPQAGLYFATVRILDPGIAGLLLYLYPSFVVIIGLVVLRRRPGWLRALAVLLSLAGCFITFWKAGSYPLAGIILGLIMAIVYASYLVVGERILAEVDPIMSTAIMMSCAALVYWVACLLTGESRLPVTPRAIGGIVGVAFVATIIPVTTLLASMRIIGAADASLVSTLEPVLTIIWSSILIGERFGPAQVFGGSLILLAVIAIDLAPKLAAMGRGRAKPAAP